MKLLKLSYVRQVITTCLFLLVFSVTAWGEQPPFLSREEWIASAGELAAEPTQVVVIEARHGVSANVAVWQMIGGVWTQVLGPWPAVIGKNGMALRGQKKEGDGKTPSGLFPISIAFGEAEQSDTGMPYRRADDQDIWIDDPQSPLYNQWSKLPTTARSFERMRRKDSLYKLGLVVDYNRRPVVPGDGSAIFIHIWRNESKGTAGCAAMAENHVRELVHTLRLENHPVALFLP